MEDVYQRTSDKNKTVEDIFEAGYPTGVTISSKNEFTRLQDAVGKVECVVVTNLISKPASSFNGFRESLDTETIVVGDEARLHFSGFSIGYMGEGPRGLIWLLDQLNIPYSRKDIFTKPETNSIIFSVPEEG